MHFGAPDPERSRVREKHFVSWLRKIEPEASDLFLVGDLFDFWFEYRHAVPKGYMRFLGELARLADAGVKLHVFAGNHDLWYKTYLTEELGATLYFTPQVITLRGKKCYIAHGDGLGPGDHGYKAMKAVFQSPFSRWLFRWLHPDVGIGLALWLSKHSGDHNYEAEHRVGDFSEDEWLMQHARSQLALDPDIDCFIFGHRHVLVQRELSATSSFFILGDWIQYFSYLEMSDQGVDLKSFPLTQTENASSIPLE
jgi:UDP-2,3-diacylglucosamine hydrolase